MSHDKILPKMRLCRCKNPKAFLTKGGRFYFVACRSCGIEGANRRRQVDAILDWNTWMEGEGVTGFRTVRMRDAAVASG